MYNITGSFKLIIVFYLVSSPWSNWFIFVKDLEFKNIDSVQNQFKFLTGFDIIN